MKKTTKPFYVLIPDGETFAFPYILHSLSEIRNFRLIVMSTKKDFPLRYSRYVHRFLFFPKQNDKRDWIKIINTVTEKYGVDLIMPIFETGIKILLENKPLLLHNSSKLVPLPSLHDFNVASNKALLAVHLDNIGLSGPKTAPLTSDIINEETNLMLKFPVLSKPLKSGSGRGIVKFEDHKSLKDHFETIGLNEPYILQEYIQGQDYGCNVLCLNGEILAYTIQKGNLWGSKPYSAQIGLDFVYNEDLFQAVKKLMKSLNWNGVANIDLIFDPKNDVFHILEINPRFWSSITASLLAGINFPKLLIYLSIGEKIEPQDYKRMGYVVLYGLKEYCRKNKISIYDLGFIWNSTPIRYKIKDPGPLAYEYVMKTKKQILVKINKLFGRKEV
ncbi:ATP-grasp domain-containing protein [Aquiflexum gelatinilyticum]|uniref:ATP-grasp domain-containing protein n=1 Tax=Aquiflexum gelatinilyticum TaxID=2961943 RepID=A0A9X2PAY1_9BACT|nr:ATP-grasp domain-containing protein [Aquiflexum gelatinilyticum]MCR9016692.1 ATP-grasp domain-containing protein [Aquiflexum gelatinilyticum]MCS4432873.1 ATP-grasp domain-containing protein [Aquiflexum gelatinilyticum]